MPLSAIDVFLRSFCPTLGGEEEKLAVDLLEAATGLVTDHPERIDLKITASAVAEMRQAFRAFAPYRHIPKVTIFGSARTQADDPLYTQAQDVARLFASQGWMVVTGAGPGIMAAASEGAGRAHSFGVNIRLPFEEAANPFIDADTKLVSMKYFFTRKLMLIKESRGFVCLPGGFGTLDETFELLTLTQTGKGAPVPIVFLDTPGDPYWETVHEFVGKQLVKRGLVSAADTGLYLMTEDCHAAAREITRFYANYDSLRYVGDLLVMRVRFEPTGQQIALLNERFGHLCKRGTINSVAPLDPERKDADRLDLYRVAFTFAKHGYGELRSLIDTLNSFVPDSKIEAPTEAPTEASVEAPTERSR